MSHQKTIESLLSLALRPYEARDVRDTGCLPAFLALVEEVLERPRSECAQQLWCDYVGRDEIAGHKLPAFRNLFVDYAVALAQHLSDWRTAPHRTKLWAMAFAMRRLDAALGRAPEPHEIAGEGFGIAFVIENGLEAATLAEAVTIALQPVIEAEAA